MTALNSDKQILFYSPAAEGSNEAKVFRNAFEKNASIGRTTFCSGGISLLKMIRLVWRCDILFVHTSLIKSFSAMVIAILLRRRIISFTWDKYPVLIGGQRYDRRPQRYVADLIENMLTASCATLLVPTKEFLDFFPEPKGVALRYWYNPGLSQGAEPPVERTPPADIKIAFLGQTNETRGLAQCIEHLDAISSSQITLDVFSRDDVSLDGTDKVTVRYGGFLPLHKAQEKLQAYDFGLVSLHPDFEGPAFPSKSIDYLVYGLPVLYFGPNQTDYVSALERFGVGWHISPLDQLDLHTVLDQAYTHRNAQGFLDHFSMKEGALAAVI